MGFPSSQTVAEWVKELLCGTDWQPLEDICLSVALKLLPKQGNDVHLEFVEQNLPFVAEHLREECSEYLLDGRASTFEIDEEPRPYIRLLQSVPEAKGILSKLRSVDSISFEHICAQILDKLGANAQVTGGIGDGGVDFFGFNLPFLSYKLAIPQPCRMCVIGQAKHHKASTTVSETKLREFIGASALRRHQFIKDGRLSALTPVIYAFWTTSNFDKGAKQFGREIGMWYMDGLTLADYIRQLDLKNYVSALPSALRKDATQGDAELPSPVDPA